MSNHKRHSPQSKDQKVLLAHLSAIKSMVEDALQRDGGVERVRHYSGPDPVLRELHRLLAALNSLVRIHPKITATHVNEICNSIKKASTPISEKHSIHLIGKDARAVPPITKGLFSADVMEWKGVGAGLQKEMAGLLQSDAVKALRKAFGLPAIEERKIISPPHTPKRHR